MSFYFTGLRCRMCGASFPAEALALQHPSLVGVCLSGSGPSILALATGDFDEVAGLFRDLYTRLQVSCEVRAVAAHQPGAVS